MGRMDRSSMIFFFSMVWIMDILGSCMRLLVYHSMVVMVTLNDLMTMGRSMPMLDHLMTSFICLDHN